MIIDAHTHCFPDHIAARAIPMLAARAKIKQYVDGTVQELLNSMDRVGVDVSVIQNIATKPEQVQSINNWAAEIQSTRIRCFGTIHPDYAYWSKEIERIAQLGMIGIKFHPDYQNFDVDEERMLPLYEKTVQSGLMLLFHAGLDVGFGEPVRCQPKALAKIVRRFPEATIIGAHMGGYARWEEALEHLAGQNIYLDTSYSFDYAPQKMLLDLLKVHGAKRILFATDSPWGDQQRELEHIAGLPLQTEERQLILGRNMERLIKIHTAKLGID